MEIESPPVPALSLYSCLLWAAALLWLGGCTASNTPNRDLSLGIGSEKQQIGAVVNLRRTVLTASVWSRFKSNWIVADRVNGQLKVFQADGTFRRSYGDALFKKGRDVAYLFPYGERLIVIVRHYAKKNSRYSDHLVLMAADGTTLQSIRFPRPGATVEDLMVQGDSLRVMVDYPRAKHPDQKGGDQPRYRPASLVIYRYERMILQEVATLQGTIELPSSSFLKKQRIDRRSVYSLRLYRRDELIGLFRVADRVYLFRCDDTLTNFEVLSPRYHDRHTLLSGCQDGRWFLQETRRDGLVDVTEYTEKLERARSYRIPERGRYGQLRRIAVINGHLSTLYISPQRVNIIYY